MTTDVVFLRWTRQSSRHNRPPTFTIEHIGELADLDLSPLIKRPTNAARAPLEMP